MTDETATDPKAARAYPPGALPLIRRAKRRLRWSLAVGLLLGPSIGLVIAALGGKAVIYGGIAGGMISFFGLLAAFAFWLEDRATISRLDAFRRGDHLAHWTYSPAEWQAYDAAWTPAAPLGEAYIGRDSAYCGGTFIRWNVAGCSLEKVAFDVGPPVLIQFVLYHYDPNGAAWRDALCVPVPAGREAEARAALETILAGWRKSYFAIIMSAVLVVGSLLLVGLTLAVWAGVIK